MRARAAIVACVAVFGAFAPARAHTSWRSVQFEAPIPCGAACGLDPMSGDTDLCGPAIAGTFGEIVTEPAPVPADGKQVILQVEIYPYMDWDLAVCAGSRVDTDPFDPQCNHYIPYPVGVGCTEQAHIPAQGGRSYVIRAHNRWDVQPAPGRYRWLFV